MGSVCCPKDAQPQDVVEFTANTSDGLCHVLDMQKYAMSQEFVAAIAQGYREVPLTAIESIESIGNGDVDDDRVGGPAKRSTGYVTRDEVRLSSGQPKAVTFNQQVAPAAIDSAPTGCSNRVQGRKGTGFVSKEKLLAILVDDSDEEASISATPPTQAPMDPNTRQCRERRGIGFVTKAKLKKVLDSIGDDEE